MDETARLRWDWRSLSRSVAIPGLWISIACLILHPRLCADDLQTAYQQAASTSPALAQAHAQLDAALAGKPLARSALLPHLQAGASGGMNTARVTGFGAQQISGGYHSDTFSASLTQSVFDGQALIALKESDSRIREGQAALAYAEQNLTLAVTQAYFTILKTQADARVAVRQVDLLQSIEDETAASLHVGTGDIISVREAQARLDAAKAERITAANAVAIAKSQLERLTHHPVGALQDITILQATGPEPDAVGPWIAEALKNQPLLRQAEAAQQESEQQVEYQQRARWPTLTLSGIGQHSAGVLIPPVAIDQIGASLNLSIPVYEGGRIRAGTHQAQALSRNSRAKVAEIEDQITLDTQTAFLDLENSVAQFHAAQEAVRSAQTSLDATRKGFEIGSRSIIDLLTATTQLASAERTYSLALYTQLVARVQLKAAAGVLTPQDVQAINALLSANPEAQP
ncbi:MAG TPA: TolC family outer membrane protein [Acidobacteriaceae bacterium]|nr:TolC family outer membrane protein [Acidobacteriaceae bacterium]